METLSVWANGFGVWSCRVTFPGIGYGPLYLDANADRIRAKARRAIRREILARNTGQIAPVRVVVSASNLNHMNIMRSVTFTEK